MRNDDAFHCAAQGAGPISAGTTWTTAWSSRCGGTASRRASCGTSARSSAAITCRRRGISTAWMSPQLELVHEPHRIFPLDAAAAARGPGGRRWSRTGRALDRHQRQDRRRDSGLRHQGRCARCLPHQVRSAGYIGMTTGQASSPTASCTRQVTTCRRRRRVLPPRGSRPGPRREAQAR